MNPRPKRLFHSASTIIAGLPEAEVKPEVLKAVAAARRLQSVRHTASGATVVVERRRRVAMPAR